MSWPAPPSAPPRPRSECPRSPRAPPSDRSSHRQDRPARPGRHPDGAGHRHLLEQKNHTFAGRKVALVSADTGGNPAGAKTKASELIERDRVDVVFGPLAAFEMLAINDCNPTSSRVRDEVTAATHALTSPVEVARSSS